jgi:Zn-dependent peptidase ImmA (M78 family)
VAAKWFVKTAKLRVDALRRRLLALDYECPLEGATDVAAIAGAYLNCELVVLSGLSDETALTYLEAEYSIDTSGESRSKQPLAGGLYVSSDGFYRWLFVEKADVPQRRRFTIAHELAHLLLEAEPSLKNRQLEAQELVAREKKPGVMRFGRCSEESLQQWKPLTKADIVEIDANHFAAELLMPYDGVQQILGEVIGSTGIKTESDLLRVVNRLVAVYDVSRTSAEKRLTKDFGIVPHAKQATRDLFD